MTCRDEVLAAIVRLERRTDRNCFSLVEIADEVMAVTGDYSAGTIRTTVERQMCADGPDTTYADLDEVATGRFAWRASLETA